MPARVTIFQFVDDPSLGQDIFEALYRLSLPIELHLNTVELPLTRRWQEQSDLVIVAATAKTPAQSLFEALNSGLLFRETKYILVMDYPVDINMHGISALDFSVWDKNEFDDRIGYIVRAIDQSSNRILKLFPLWEAKVKKFRQEEAEKADKAAEYLSIPITDLTLSARTVNIFKSENIVYIGDIVQRTEAEWLRTPNFGRMSLVELKELLKPFGLRLGMEILGWPPNDMDRQRERYLAARRVLEMSQEKLGVTFEASRDLLIIDSSGSDSDALAALKPMVIQLHSEIIRKARTFSSVASRLDNQSGWQGINGLCDRLVELLDRPTAEISDVIGGLYSTALEVGSFYELDAAINRGSAAYAPPLDAEVRRPLEDLVRSLAPWLRSFPTIREMDDEAGQFLTPPSDLRVPKNVIETAGQVALISPEDAHALKGLLEAAERGEFQGVKAGHRGRQSALNMVIAVAGVFGGLVLSDYGGKSVLIGRAGTFLSNAETGITELVADLPTDLRAAVEIVLRERHSLPLVPPQGPLPSRSAASAQSLPRREED